MTPEEIIDRLEALSTTLCSYGVPLEYREVIRDAALLLRKIPVVLAGRELPITREDVEEVKAVFRETCRTISDCSAAAARAQYGRSHY